MACSHNEGDFPGGDLLSAFARVSAGTAIPSIVPGCLDGDVIIDDGADQIRINFQTVAISVSPDQNMGRSKQCLQLSSRRCGAFKTDTTHQRDQIDTCPPISFMKEK
jgi:hypothetical protein